jgi:hypothetical protein
MKNIIVSVTDRKTTAQSLDVYFETVMHGLVSSYYMTYHDTRYSPELVRQTDLFVLDLFATDSRGLYTEGIFVAEKWLSFGKRVLVLSGAACAGVVNSHLYWDLEADGDLGVRITSLLEGPLPKAHDLTSVKAYFHKFYRRAEDPHRIAPDASPPTTA